MDFIIDIFVIDHLSVATWRERKIYFR